MKKAAFIIAAILIFAMVKSIAQPNGGFETWNTSFNYQEPVGWQTLNFLSITIPSNPLSVFQASGIDKHSGNYALKIKTVYVSNNPIPSVIDDTMGVAFTGKITLSPPGYTYGFPYAQRPANLEFWAKYQPVGSDTAGVRILLTKWDGFRKDTIAESEANIPATPAYSLFQVPVTYFSNTIPDTAVILFGSSKSKYVARPNSTLYVDDVAFTGWVGIDELNAYSDKVKVFPNPATDNVTIQAQIKEAVNAQIMDVSGKAIAVSKFNNYNAIINTSSFPAGNYFYEIHDKKNNILTGGKFSVVK